MHGSTYPTHDIELAAVVFALMICHDLLYGVLCEVLIDNRSLQQVFTQKDMNPRQRRWIKLLEDYNVTIQHHPGKAIVVANNVSQKAVRMGSLIYFNVFKRPLLRNSNIRI